MFPAAINESIIIRVNKKTTIEITIKIGIYLTPSFSSPFIMRPMIMEANADVIATIAIAK